MQGKLHKHLVVEKSRKVIKKEKTKRERKQIQKQGTTGKKGLAIKIMVYILAILNFKELQE